MDALGNIWNATTTTSAGLWQNMDTITYDNVFVNGGAGGAPMTPQKDGPLDWLDRRIEEMRVRL